MYTYLHVLCPSLRVLGFGKAQRRQQGGGVGGFLLPLFYPPPQRERKRGKENKGRHTFLKKGTFQLNLWNKRPLFGEKVHFILKYISKYNKTYLHPWKTHFVFFLIQIIYDAILYKYVFLCFLNVRRLSLSLIAWLIEIGHLNLSI